MSVQWLGWVFERAEVTGGQRLVLLSLANHADDTGECWPSIDTVCREARMSRRRVEAAISLLVKSGLIDRKVNGAPVKGHQGYRPNLYRLTKHTGELSTAPDEPGPANTSAPDEKAPPKSSGPDKPGGAVSSTAGPDESSVKAPTNRPGKPSVEPSREPSQPKPIPDSPSKALAVVTEISTTLAVDPCGAVFDAWISSTGRTGRTKLDPKRRRCIERALTDYPLDDVVAAVRGWRHSAHHRGENDQGTVYNDIELLLRDSRQIEKFRDLELRRPELQRPASEPKGFAGIRAAMERRGSA